ncbi:MAG: hypothetical protein IT539_03865 [Bradyrhizobiaceae bacterium]|nr:hypothetical protein [Bradyrhizobiaceae bacterium]
MANSQNPFQPAIDELEKELEKIEKDIAEAERQANGLRDTINVLRAKAGLPPRPEGIGRVAASPSPAPEGGGPSPKIRHDSFFGKKMGTATREYLEMRQESAGGTSPAKPREIFDALKLGGFVFETKDDNVAIISLRNMLRKNTQMFQKLPNGTYGLRSWYPGARKPKNTSVENASGDDEETEDVGKEKYVPSWRRNKPQEKEPEKETATDGSPPQQFRRRI